MIATLSVHWSLMRFSCQLPQELLGIDHPHVPLGVARGRSTCMYKIVKDTAALMLLFATRSFAYVLEWAQVTCPS